MAPSRGIHRLAAATAAATFVLLFVGGLVTSTGSGLAVPDWPLLRPGLSAHGGRRPLRARPPARGRPRRLPDARPGAVDRRRRATADGPGRRAPGALRRRPA